MKTRTNILTLSFLCLTLFAAGSWAADPIGEPGRSSGKPNPLKNVYFGEQHLHTQDSKALSYPGLRSYLPE